MFHWMTSVKKKNVIKLPLLLGYELTRECLAGLSFYKFLMAASHIEKLSHYWIVNVFIENYKSV